MAEYRNGLNTVFSIQYHLVWVTKARHEVLRGEVAERTRELMRQGCMSREIDILMGRISKDHVHLLISAPPESSPANIAKYLKARSSRLLQQEYSHLKERYGGQQLWASGYFCGTTGDGEAREIEKYLGAHTGERPLEPFTVEPE